MDEPKSPLEAYKAIIDQLVQDTRRSLSSRLIMERGVCSMAPSRDAHNQFVASLSPQQRALLADMLQEERDSAIHDLLAVLTWWIIVQDVGLTFRGEKMPVDLSGMGLHGDFIGRLDGWAWPTETTPE